MEQSQDDTGFDLSSATERQQESQMGVLMKFMEQQMRAAEARDKAMQDLFKNVQSRSLSPSQPQFTPQPSAPAQSTSQTSAPRPVNSVSCPHLLSSATLADFHSFVESWRDFSVCQHLASQAREARVATLRQCFDEELRRFIREDIICIPASADVDLMLERIQAYIRRQRNPLLDRIEFYQRVQQAGESFDAFYTALCELQSACDFLSHSLCGTCDARCCAQCKGLGRTLKEESLRDRVVIGVRNDETRHKLLATHGLTLDQAVTLCRTEEAAYHTKAHMPSPGLQASAAKQSAYKQQKRHKPADSKPSETSSATKSTCPNCGRSDHTKSVCPAKGKKCNSCHGIGHFQRMCKSQKQPKTSSAAKLGQLKLQRASRVDRRTVPVSTMLQTEDQPSQLSWTPDTGSDVDAIGEEHLTQIGGFVENLDDDHDCVQAVTGEPLRNLGKIRATLRVGETQHETVIHVYKGLHDALLSHTSLRALKFLPPDWPVQFTAEHEGASSPKICAAVSSCAHPSDAELARTREQLLQEFADVFSDSGLKPMEGPPMEIELQHDSKPSCVHTARPIPYAFRDQIKTQLDGMVSDGIIEPVTEPSEWCHPIVIVDKKGSTEKRLTVDFKRLNDQVRRPAHPVHTARDVVSGVGSAKFFTKLDARHGYWQIPLSDTAQEFTTFITPYGRYRYLRNPQGLISAGDEFNRRTDAAFSAIPRLGKVVDDCLAYDDDFLSHVSHVREILLCAREHGITFSPAKFVFGTQRIHFCGYNVTPDGWVVDDDKTSGIRQFPVPANRTDLRSFLGLVNQCGEFTPHLAELTNPLRGLLKTSREFMWDASHTAAFERTQEALLSPPVLAFYQVGQDLRLETDASALRGLGFVLWQKQNDQWRIIQCGSRYLSDAETRYAVIELEMLAVVWAVRKCRIYLSGAPFEVVTDHKPLIPIINSYSLDQIENPRLLRLRLKLQAYQLQASWRKGSENAFADALSRNPVGIPSTTDELGEAPSLHCRSIQICMVHSDTEPNANLKVAELREAAAADATYQSLIECILTGFPDRQQKLPAPLRAYWNGREHLSVDHGIVLKGNRIVVPESLRAQVLHNLHASHQGLVRTKSRARQLVYWSGITKDIDTLVRSCPACREHQSSQPAEPLLNDRTPTLPFECASADLFTCQGHDFLVYADRLTGWPCVARTGRTTSSHDVILAFRRWFSDVGVPAVLCTDGGPQFSSHKFAEFCKRWQVNHVMSSPHYPQSNGHAEAAVKAMKRLITKTTVNGNLDTDDFRRGLLEWRNTPGSSGQSPAELLYGRSLQSFVIAHWKEFDSSWLSKATTRDETAMPSDDSVTDKSSTRRSLPQLRLGTHVDVQHPRTKQWSIRGVIVAVGNHRDYLVKLPSGRIYWRNRRFLRPYRPLVPAPLVVQPAAADASSPPPPSRRSARQRKPPQRLNIGSHHGQSYD
eukprot:scpid17782/ scgid3606/ Retrotransposable element Tf2 155 kDa protein type 1